MPSTFNPPIEKGDDFMCSLCLKDYIVHAQSTLLREKEQVPFELIIHLFIHGCKWQSRKTSEKSVFYKKIKKNRKS